MYSIQFVSCCQLIAVKFTYTKSFSLPVARNKLETDSVSSIRPPNVNTFIFQFNSFKMRLIHLWYASASQNIALGFVSFSRLTISWFESDETNGIIEQFKQVVAIKIDANSSQWFAINANDWRGWRPCFCRFCAARIVCERISLNVSWTPVSPLICKEVADCFFFVFKFNESYKHWEWPDIPGPLYHRASKTHSINVYQGRLLGESWVDL